MLREVPFGAKIEGKKRGVFVAFTAWCPIYADYVDPTMLEAARKAMYPVVLMSVRWDGRMGLIGGFTDGMAPTKAASKEALEEAGIFVQTASLVPMVSHEGESIVVDLYRYDLGTVHVDALCTILRFAPNAEHSVSEGCCVWAHLANYGRDKGWPTLRASTSLAFAVGEELDAVRAAMYAAAPEGAWPENGPT